MGVKMLDSVSYIDPNLICNEWQMLYQAVKRWYI